MKRILAERAPARGSCTRAYPTPLERCYDCGRLWADCRCLSGPKPYPLQRTTVGAVAARGTLGANIITTKAGR